jgi:hypothetical protein
MAKQVLLIDFLIVFLCMALKFACVWLSLLLGFFLIDRANLSSPIPRSLLQKHHAQEGTILSKSHDSIFLFPDSPPLAFAESS